MFGIRYVVQRLVPFGGGLLRIGAGAGAEVDAFWIFQARGMEESRQYLDEKGVDAPAKRAPTSKLVRQVNGLSRLWQ